MSEAYFLCPFCGKQEKKNDVSGLQMCAKCVSRYGNLCRTYSHRILSQIASIGWDVDLISHAPQDEDFPKFDKPLFYIRCRKGPVAVTTAIDKAAFFAAASRLQNDMKAPRRHATQEKRTLRRGKQTK